MLSMLDNLIHYWRDYGILLTIYHYSLLCLSRVYCKLILGGGIRVEYPLHIVGRKNISFGKNFFAAKHLWLEATVVYKNTHQVFKPKIVIKDNVNIGEFSHISATNYIEIGNNVLMGSKVYITDNNHGIYSGSQQTNPIVPPLYRKLTSDSRVVIGDNVFIGEFVCILPNVKLGEGCIIGANSVVTKDIPEYCIAVGNPAIIIKKYDFDKDCWVSNI